MWYNVTLLENFLQFNGFYMNLKTIIVFFKINMKQESLLIAHPAKIKKGIH